MKALIYSLVRPLAEPAEPRLPVFRFIHGRDYYHVFAIAKTRKYDQGGNKRSLGAKTRSSSAPTRYAARLLKGRNDGDHFFCGKRPFDLSPDLGRGLLLRIPPHGRIGRCHGLARGAPRLPRFRNCEIMATVSKRMKSTGSDRSDVLIGRIK